LTKSVLASFFRLCIAYLLLSVHVSALANDQANLQVSPSIEAVNDLRVLQQQANLARLPVVLLLATEDCSYCKAVKDNYLLPMSMSGEFKSKALIRQLYVDDFSYLRNLQGEMVGGDQIGLQYRVEVIPTVLFIDADGKELADRIIGVTNIDFYGALLEERIEQARKAQQADFVQ
jgi:thioredoxin-related protein